MANADRISLSTIRSCVSVIENHGNKINNYFGHIQKNYLDDTQTVWNTPSANTYVTGVSNSLNDFISQFNTKFKEGFKDFIDGGNKLSRSQNASDVKDVNMPNIKTTSVTWQGQENDFNVPQDYGSFTDTNLNTGGIKQIKEEIAAISRAVDTAHSQGLDGAYCGQIKSAINKLSDSASEVIESYGKDAAKAAVEEDTLLSGLRSNT